MEHIEFVYTFGMTEDEMEERLKENRNGVLSLADGGAAYGVPISYHYEDGKLYVRLADHEGSKKMEYVETTTEASFLLYEYREDGSSWSIVALGSLEKVGEQYDATALNEKFPELRVFDESIGDISPEIFEFSITEVTGRQTELPS
jgi:hypothetical protein